MSPCPVCWLPWCAGHEPLPVIHMRPALPPSMPERPALVYAPGARPVPTVNEVPLLVSRWAGSASTWTEEEWAMARQIAALVQKHDSTASSQDVGAAEGRPLCAVCQRFPAVPGARNCRMHGGFSAVLLGSVPRERGREE